MMLGLHGIRLCGMTPMVQAPQILSMCMLQTKGIPFKYCIHIDLWMTDMESSDHIRQKDIVFAYSKKQDQVG